MSAKGNGPIRVGCGRYDWYFTADQRCLTQRLVITIEIMQVLPATMIDDVMGWLAGLPYPCWTFQVVPSGAGTSRLVVRFQSDFKPTPMGWMAYKYALKPVHFVMERKMMLGIKQRAEHLT